MTGAGILNWFEPSDADIQRVCKMLKIKPDTFHSAVGAERRLEVLKAKNHIDVEACPGSGKTTLLVAKLALLAEKWPHRTRGICVLSHTNVARREIEKRLGSTVQGRTLLSYPHFVGTIHHFMNEFVAMPHLRSEGRPVDMIDDELVLDWRWRRLPYGTQYYITKKNPQYEDPKQLLRIDSLDLDFTKLGSRTTDTFAAAQRVARESMDKGWFCYQEMLILAQHFVASSDELHIGVRERFPLIFLDEVQDTDANQANLVHTLFTDGEPIVVQQRFGDSNQEIFNERSSSQKKGVTATYDFPIDARKIDIPNSYRFGQSIANLVSPLAVSPVELVGLRDVDENSRFRNTIFLFQIEHIHQVPYAFANYLRKVCSEEELGEGDFVVVGALHKQIDDARDEHIPKSLVHYWDGYDATISSSEPKPKTFIQYIRAGHRLSAESGNSFECVEKIAEAVLRAVMSTVSSPPINLRKRKHRQVLELIGDHQDIRTEYLALVEYLAIDCNGLERDVWESTIRATVTKIVGALTIGEEKSNNEDDLKKFLRYPASDQSTKTKTGTLNNRLSVQRNGGTDITLRFGSIHSVKGETHTATLVVDTFNRTHHLKKLKPWLAGKKRYGAGEDEAMKSRMRLHYVASTRPTKLLCLAIRKDAVSDTEKESLQANGWKICVVGPNADLNWI